MSKIKKTALMGVVGASALTAGYYTFVKPSIQITPSNQKNFLVKLRLNRYAY